MELAAIRRKRRKIVEFLYMPSAPFCGPLSSAHFLYLAGKAKRKFVAAEDLRTV